MPDTKFVLDANTIMLHLNDAINLDSFLSAWPECGRCISVVGFIEVLSKPDISPEDDQEARDFLSDCEIMDITPSIREKAIQIRRFKKTIKLPDAVIAATALELGATLLSSDDHMKNLAWPGLTVLDVMDSQDETN
ncbi:MAG: type II toxin-antitoxin system VapC family toxin [Spirochaetaceae bacterium]|nr:type II toxin-antitoxin system VapC family toxin [Spirochaetaceae bacterium]